MWSDDEVADLFRRDAVEEVDAYCEYVSIHTPIRFPRFDVQPSVRMYTRMQHYFKQHGNRRLWQQLSREQPPLGNTARLLLQRGDLDEAYQVASEYETVFPEFTDLMFTLPVTDKWIEYSHRLCDQLRVLHRMRDYLGVPAQRGLGVYMLKELGVMGWDELSKDINGVPMKVIAKEICLDPTIDIEHAGFFLRMVMKDPDVYFGVIRKCWQGLTFDYLIESTRHSTPFLPMDRMRLFLREALVFVPVEGRTAFFSALSRPLQPERSHEILKIVEENFDDEMIVRDLIRVLLPYVLSPESTGILGRVRVRYPHLFTSYELSRLAGIPKDTFLAMMATMAVVKESHSILRGGTPKLPLVLFRSIHGALVEPPRAELTFHDPSTVMFW
jgi:hypothetical protein